MVRRWARAGVGCALLWAAACGGVPTEGASEATQEALHPGARDEGSEPRRCDRSEVQRLEDDDVGAARAVVQRAGHRLGLGLETTVVALAGPTGAGKSSLFNALAGTEKADCLARVKGTASGQQRTTTSGSVGGGGVIKETTTTTTVGSPTIVTVPGSSASAPSK